MTIDNRDVMSTQSFFKTMVGLTFAGVLFSGYLSAVKLFSGTCAFNEGCPYFLGYPACLYGFAMFLIMFVASIVGLRKSVHTDSLVKVLRYVSLLGIVFAGRFVVLELVQLIRYGNPHYKLLLPTCAYGLVFYIIIFLLTFRRRDQV